MTYYGSSVIVAEITIIIIIRTVESKGLMNSMCSIISLIPFSINLTY